MKTPFLKGGVERIMILGVPRMITILEFTIATAFTFALRNPWTIPVIICVHLWLAYLYRNDPFFVEILYDHIIDPEHLDV